MQKRKLRNSLVIFISLLMFSTVYAKDGEGHSWDMLGVLGLYSSSDLSKSYANLSAVQSLFTKVNDYCDKLNVTNSEGASDNYYNQLKKEFNFFTYEQKYTHRQIYHWGFDFDKDLTSEGIPSREHFCLKRLSAPSKLPLTATSVILYPSFLLFFQVQL